MPHENGDGTLQPETEAAAVMAALTAFAEAANVTEFTATLVKHRRMDLVGALEAQRALITLLFTARRIGWINVRLTSRQLMLGADYYYLSGGSQVVLRKPGVELSILEITMNTLLKLITDSIFAEMLKVGFNPEKDLRSVVSCATTRALAPIRDHEHPDRFNDLYGQYHEVTVCWL